MFPLSQMYNIPYVPLFCNGVLGIRVRGRVCSGCDLQAHGASAGWVEADGSGESVSARKLEEHRFAGKEEGADGVCLLLVDSQWLSGE
jgi:hypothetical protein